MPAQLSARRWMGAIVLLTAATLLSAGQRVWTDSTGTFQVHAELVTAGEDYVILRKENGETVRVPIDRLSDRDRKHLQTLEDAEGPDEPATQEKKPQHQEKTAIGADAVRSAKEAAIAFFAGLREPDRSGAREVLTKTAQEASRSPDSPFGHLPAPDPGTKSILTGRVTIEARVAEVPVRVSTAGIFHNTSLHMRFDDAQWKIFAISASYPEGVKTFDFEAEPMPAAGGNPLETLVGQPMPLAGYTLTGQPLDMSQFAGKIVLVDFWATWCGPCREEMPNILKNWRQYHNDGFEVVAVSLDRDMDALRQFVVENQLPWTVVADKDPRNQNELAARYGIRAIPALALIGRDGKVAAVNCRGRRLEQELARLIAEEQE